MFRALLALSVSACATCRPDAAPSTATTTVYVVRHAEKARGPGNDPNLTTVGRTRARALVAALDGVELDAIYATQYRRTQQTVAPTAEAHALQVRVVRAGDTNGLVESISSELRGKQVLVAGHYNTVPKVIRALGVDEAVTLTEHDHGDLFVVTIAGDGTASLERRRFDP